ncbi:hypothetical protein EQ875_01624 [Photobacterium damselae subsp. damselae]|uniref:hypothetical protein n=1 Tax=Photobacterium damselae TaxID=38293 RepID=UPI00109B9D77|nr:hypothetical protein [Photobacterium damselae]TGZ35343.1 hypothetical protein EQ875_01624 [Photobacterium damselae subsp. damselae]
MAEQGNLKIENSRTNYPKLMQEFNGGVTGDIIGAMMTDVALAVARSNRKGEITIKLTLKPGNSDDNEFLNADFMIKKNEPKLDKGSKVEDVYQGSIIFVGKNGKCTVDRQKESHTGQQQLAIANTAEPVEDPLKLQSPSETVRKVQ